MTLLNKANFKISILVLMPIVFGIISKCLGFILSECKYSFTLSWSIKGILLFHGIFLLLGEDLYLCHISVYKHFKINTLLLWQGLYFVLILSSLLFKTDFSYNVITSMLLGPILEETISRSIFLVHNNDDFKTTFLIVLSSISFSLLHWFYYDIPCQFVSHISKFLGHFTFGFAAAVMVAYYKRLDIPIIIHAISNIPWLLSQGFKAV